MLDLDFACHHGNMSSKVDFVLKQPRYLLTWRNFREDHSKENS